jgi:putative ABC transport system permease protein
VTIISRLRSFARNLFRRSSVEHELSAEVRSYIDLLTAENIARGVSPDQARRAALIRAGGEEQLKEKVRDARTGAFLETLLRDLRYGVRMLLRAPGFTAIAVLTLALGIGANTAVFSLVYGVLLRPLPFPEADRLVMVAMRFAPQNLDFGPLSYADFLDWRAGNRAFEEPSIYTFNRFNITGSGDADQVPGASVSTGFFPTMRITPLAGRFFAPNEEGASSARLVVISEALWRRRFAGNLGAVGQVINLNGEPYTIIGVAPPSFRFPRLETELWTNLQMPLPTRRGPFKFRGIARLKPGATLAQAQQETNAIGHQIERANAGYYSQLVMPVAPLRERLVGSTRPALLVLFGAVGVVLLVALVNVSSLLLGRAATRSREIALRLSLGASRGRLWRQLLTEAVLLSGLGGAAGLALAWGSLRMLRAAPPANLPRIEDVQLDLHVLAFTAAVCVLSGVLFGLGPAFQSTRANLTAVLSEGGRSGSSGAGGRRLRAALVVAEIALSLVLLAGGGLLLRSYQRLARVDLGFQAAPRQVFIARITRIAKPQEPPIAMPSFYEQLGERVQHLPGVEAAGFSDALPPTTQPDADSFSIEGRPWTQDAFPAVTVGIVSGDYFKTLSVPLLRGRYFTAADREDAPPVVIISQSLASRFFIGEDPIGRRMRRGNGPWMEIIGVVGDVKYTAFESSSEPAYYLPLLQNADGRTWMVVRSSLPAGSLAAEIAREVHALDPDAVVNRTATLDDMIADSLSQPRFRTVLLAVFAAVALVLAAIGTYGVMAYSVAQRTREIGVRMALGAPRGTVLRMVLGEAARLAVAGLLIGLLAAAPAARAVSSLLFGIRPSDPTTYFAVAALLLTVALVASFVPARRATRIDPIKALRWE